MKTEDIRNILMLAAVEETDEGGIVLSVKDKQEASQAAGAPLPANPGRAKEEAFLAARAAALLDHIHSRFPEAARWLDPTAPAHPSRHPALVLLLLGVSAVIGYFTNELGPEKRINILSFPLLGILGWSLLVYVREAWLLLARREVTLPDFFFRGLFRERGGLPGKDTTGSATTLLEEARRQFEKRWVRLSAAGTGARMKSLLHLAALLFAASAIAGMYVRGLANEYSAVWESTFITESTDLLPVLKTVLGPAISLSGDSLPTVKELDNIRGAGSPGENAARWIHWYALTLTLFVLVPRVLLALFWRLRAHRLSRSLPYRETAPRYFGRLLATSSGSARLVALSTYAVDPDESTKSALVRRLEDEFGAAVEAVWMPAIAFGEEEEFTFEFPVGTAEIIPLFSFAATPERETHLEVYRTLSSQSPHPVRFVLLEAGAFDRKSRDFADATERRAAREVAWRKLFADESVDIILHPEAAIPV